MVVFSIRDRKVLCCKNTNLSLVAVMLFQLNYFYCNNILMYIIDNPVMCCNMT